MTSALRPSKIRFNFLSLNARSLFNKNEELSTLTKKLNPIFVCVQETWCHGGEPDSHYHMSDYSIHRRDRTDRVGGGVCIYVHTQKVQTVERLHELELEKVEEDLEAIWLKINVAGLRKSLIVGSIYRPPNTPIEPFLRNLERCLRHKRKMGDHYNPCG